MCVQNVIKLSAAVPDLSTVH